jgi:uncharacterized protein YcgI (DUF1989 family)
MTAADSGHRMRTVDAQSGLAVHVGAGEIVRVVDVEGQQVADLWVIDAADPGRWLSASHTRDRCERLFPRPRLADLVLDSTRLNRLAEHFASWTRRRRVGASYGWKIEC